MSVVTVTILSNGQPLPADWPLASVDVRCEVNRIPSATMEFIDGDAAAQSFPLSEQPELDLGRTIEVKARWEGEGSDQTLFKGSIVRHSIEAHDNTSRLVLELMHAAFRMTRVRRTAVYADMSDGDVVKRLLSAAGLSQRVPATTIKHKELVQFHCTDWDFMLSRLDALGLWLAAGPSGCVVFDPSRAAGAVKLQATFGDDVREVDLEGDASRQLKEATAAGWDPRKLATLSAKGRPTTQPAHADRADRAAKALGGAAAALADPAIGENAELTAWASARLLRNRSAFLRGRVSIDGKAVNLFDAVELKGLGKQFSGKVLVTGVCHRIADGAWVTDVQVGLPERGAIATDGVGDAPAGGVLPAVNGLQVGVVKEFRDDPEDQLRVRVALPVFGDQALVWARLATPDAGNERGFLFRPEPGDEVIVGFLNDDPRGAVVLGGLFGPKNKAPKLIGKPEKKNEKKGIVSRTGVAITIVDADKPKITIETPGSSRVCLDDDAAAITVSDKHGNTVTLDKAGITLKSAEDLVLESRGDVTIKATGNVAIQGQKVDVK